MADGLLFRKKRKKIVAALYGFEPATSDHPTSRRPTVPSINNSVTTALEGTGDVSTIYILFCET